MKLFTFLSVQLAEAVVFDETWMIKGRTGRRTRLQSNQADAQAYCENQGGTMAYFKNEGEFALFSEEEVGWKLVRLGYTRANESDPFIATNGDTDVYTDFRYLEPNVQPSNGFCTYLRLTRRKKWTEKQMNTMTQEKCDNQKRMSLCRFEEGTPEARIRNGDDFSRYEVADITANFEDASAYCHERGGYLPYNLEYDIGNYTDQDQWTGLRRFGNSFVDTVNREFEPSDDDWDVNEPSSIEGGGQCVQIGRNSDGDLKLKMQNCLQKLPFLCRYNYDCNKNIVSNRRRQLTVGQPMFLQDLQCSGSNEWSIGVSFKCKNSKGDHAEDLVTIVDNDNPSTPFFRIHRPAYTYNYEIIIPKMSENTEVEGEFFNPYPGHVHVRDREEPSPMYKTWMCSSRPESDANLEIRQTFCPETGKYTKSLFWNNLERMRYVDDVPSRIANLEFYIGGNSNPATEIKYFSVGQMDKYGGQCDVNQYDCVKPDNTTIPYGSAEWMYGKKGNNRRRRGKCYCMSRGQYKCVRMDGRDF